MRTDSVTVAVHDTVREVTTITIDRNDWGDTLRLTQVTDRERVREADRFKVQDSRLMVRTDTVYIERRDSSMVSSSKIHVSGSNTNLTNRTSRMERLTTLIKWLCAGILLVIVLLITIKVLMRRAS